MKKLFQSRRFIVLTVAGAALMTVGLAQAQQPGGGTDLRSRTQMRVAAFMDKMGQGARGLNLTNAQKGQLKSYALQRAPEARAVWANPQLTREQKFAKLQALRSGARGILTPEQQKKAETLKGQALAGAFEQLQWVSSELELTDEQEGKIRNIVINAVQKGARSGTKSPDMAAIRNVVMQTQGEINAVLTPEQQSKWAVIRSAARTEFLKRLRQLKAQTA